MPESNPLDEAFPESLDTLFSRDPLALSESDITTILTELRRMRKNFNVAEAAGVKPKRPAKAPATPKEALPTLSLDDLGI